MIVVHTRADLTEATRGRLDSAAAVMTMGALHDGHAALIRAARSRVGPGAPVMVTVFVNPTQFGAGEDFERYPRTLESDVSLSADAGADIVFAPEVAEVYSSGRAGEASIDPGPLANELEGRSRPGHFRGVATVVGKLLHLTGARYAFFGEKDYQQLVIVTAMAVGLDFGVEIVGVPTVREADGVAMSSRNRYLSADARALAAIIPAALIEGQKAAAQGSSAVERATRMHLEAAFAAAKVPAAVDYAVVRSADLGEPPPAGESRLLVAVVIDGTRLIDNVPVTLGEQMPS